MPSPAHRMGDVRALPDEPNTWGVEANGFRMRWLPGAFGDRATLAGVESFRVTDDEWAVDDEDRAWRTIKRAEVVDA